MNSQQVGLQNWKTMPLSSSVFFFAGVFCLFGALVLVASSPNFWAQSAEDVFWMVVISGMFAIIWAYVATRGKYWIFALLFPLQFLANYLVGKYSPPHASLEGNLPALKHRLLLDASVEIVLIIGAYTLFLFFFGREGNRFFRTQTEVKLAGEIHRAMVPQQHKTIGNFELFGSSVPSSEVGGDLFDIVESNGIWHAYVADVSGHGIAAGILMSMIKSAAAMQLTKLQKPDDLLRDLNDVLQPVTSPANYLTFAYVSGASGDNLSFALAGHLPILHYQRQSKTVIELSDSNRPIGLFKDATYSISQVKLPSGDLLALITDGFTEVFDSEEKEIGMEEFKTALASCAEKPLREIYEQLRAGTLKFGRQTDDQTMLLIRHRELGLPISAS
jgi:serine phosphatase RsbU (regulator of sigma subunit)